VAGDYLVFYVVIRRTVQIRRVIHGARRYDFPMRPSAPDDSTVERPYSTSHPAGNPRHARPSRTSLPDASV